MECFGFCYNQPSFGLSQNQQRISGFDAEECSGFLGNDDLTAVTDLCGAEYPLGIGLTQNVFASRHIITSLNHIFHIFHTDEL